MPAAATSSSSDTAVLKKKPISWQNLAIGAAIQTFEVSTLGQPFEVVKTHMAANRGDSLKVAIAKTYQRGGLAGFWQGLIPWAWIEASTKGGVLLFASSEIEYYSRAKLGLSSTWGGLLGGVGGGLAQAYTTMGFCTFMKTVEVTRHKDPTAAKSTWTVAADVFRKEGIRGLNKGVSAVAVRQMTNWGSRLGISRFTEKLMKGDDKNRKLSVSERIMSSVIGGALACWNQPIEVIRVEMQSAAKAANRPEKLNIWTTAKYIYQNNGMLGFYRGVTPRIGLSVYLTVCMVFGGDQVKAYFAEKSAAETKIK
ncbi:mitochondrial carrier domain-containing protein, partial [Catenaria anguillulae PL171]